MAADVVLRTDAGTMLTLDPGRWHGSVTGAEARLLSSIEGPVLDVGCGPGRLLVGLGHRGIAALCLHPAAGPRGYRGPRYRSGARGRGVGSWPGRDGVAALCVRSAAGRRALDDSAADGR